MSKIKRAFKRFLGFCAFEDCWRRGAYTMQMKEPGTGKKIGSKQSICEKCLLKVIGQEEHTNDD